MDSGSGPAAAERGSKSILQWPSRFLGPMPRLKEINLACWSLAAAIFLTRFCVPVWIQFQAGLISIPLQPSDFVYFYGIGQIVNHYPAASLYDYALQHKTFDALYFSPGYVYGPSPYPPFVALFFSPFARIPFRVAFFLWTGLSILLYAVGITAAYKSVMSWERIKVSLILCFSLAFYPFFWGIFVNGQLSAIAVCAVGVALYLERRSKLMLSGLALSMLAYKPTLLLLIVPMLLLTRRFRTLGGFMTGIAALALVSTGFGGIQIWFAYARFLALFGRAAGLQGQRTVQLWKFVDIGSCVQAVEGGRSGLALAFLIPVITIVAGALALLLWKSARGGRAQQSLAWAATLTWTLLLNVYVPMYDSILVAVALVLTLGAVENMHWSGATRWMTLMCLAIFAVSWVTYSIAMKHGVQLLSITLAGLGFAQLYLLYRANRATEMVEAS